MRNLLVSLLMIIALGIGFGLGYWYQTISSKQQTNQPIHLFLNNQHPCQLKNLLQPSSPTVQNTQKSHKPQPKTGQTTQASTPIESNNTPQQTFNNIELHKDIAQNQALILNDDQQTCRTTLSSNKGHATSQSNAAESNKHQSFWGIQLYKPTYVLPAYYTGSPYHTIYDNNTPDDQDVMSAEFKTQFSLLVPLASQVMNTATSVNFAYTQLSYWQVYAKSQYFRETDYEPELFIHHNFYKNLSSQLGIVHQSNGRGGEFERSWNRVYSQLAYHYGHWGIRIKPWILVFKSDSSDIHNPDIRDYLGNGKLELVYQNGRNQVAISSRNNLQSGFSRGMTQVQWSYRLWHYFYIYAQALSGYGQSLIEYDHYTNSAGIGIALNGL